MRKMYVLAAAGLLALAACQEIDHVAAGDGTLTVVVRSGEKAATKADVTPAGNDAAVNYIQLFLFAEDGSLYRRDTILGGATGKSLDRVKAGSYELVAVANGPALDSVRLKEDLEKTAIELDVNDPEAGFLMYGQTPERVRVESEATTAARAEVTVRRHVARVRLTTVQNKLPAAYGGLNVEYAFLENALGQWDYGATGTPSAWVNHAGRKPGRNESADASDYLSSAADAAYADLTFRALGTIVDREDPETFNAPFYSFPNACTAADDHFGATAESACLRLVLKASYDGDPARSWYYPVTIENVERNKSYDVSFIISGPGTSDPNGKVENGNLQAVITVDPWGDGGDFTGDF